MFLVAVLGMIIFSVAELLSAWIIDPLLKDGFIDKNTAVIAWLPFAIMAIFTLRMIGAFLTDYYMAWVSRHVIYDLRQAIFNQFLHIPLDYYNKNTAGSMQSRMIYDVEQLADASSSAITVIIRDSITIILFVAYMLYISWQLTMVLFVIIPLIIAIVVYISKMFRQTSHRIQQSMGNVNSISDEAIAANKEIKIFDGIKYEFDKFSAINLHNKKQFLKFFAINALSTPLIQQIAAVALATIVYFATNNIFVPDISANEFATYMFAMARMMMNSKRLTSINATLQRGIAAAQSIFEFIDLPREIDNGTKEVERIKGKIEFDNVNFHYDNQASEAIQSFNLQIAPGESVALVGRSGAGKTTLVNLLPRFYDIKSGSIKIDNIDISELTLRNLRSHIAIVSQHVTLFNDTIAHNIAYGALETASEEDIIAAAKAAHAWEFIEVLPDRLQTIVGENGVMLSGGQRQRLAIARAILKDAPILILDEATSALDTESERKIQNALSHLMKSRTTLVIAHRLSTIEHVDRIVVLDKGRMIEQGTHKDLLTKGGNYAELYEIQFKSDS